MSATPPEHAPSANEAPFFRVRQVFRYVERHRVLVGILLYAYATAAGLVYSEVIYWRTGINPYDFFGATDFLLAGLRHPIALGTLAIVVITFYLVVSLPSRFRRQRAKRRSAMIKLVKARLLQQHEPSECERLLKRLQRLQQQAEQAKRSEAHSLAHSLYVVIAVCEMAVIPPAVATFSFYNCARAAQILLRKESVGEEGVTKPLSRKIVGSIQSMLLVSDEGRGTYSAISMEVIQEITSSGPSKQPLIQNLACMVVR